MAKKRAKKTKIPGLVILTVLLLLVMEFMALLAVTQLVPMHLIFVVGLILVTFVLFVGLLSRNYKKKVRFALGCLLAVLLSIAMIMGNLYVFTTYNTLTKISNVTVQTSEASVFVLTDDPAETIEDAENYTFGIMTTLDTETTTEAIKQINEALSVTVTTKGYSGLTDLIDSLLTGECGAIVMNYAYLSLLEDLDDYEDISDYVRELSVLRVEKIIEENSSSSSDTTCTDTEETENIIRLYISGIDTRGSTIINTRSDVNIIATINTETKQILLVSTPRDYYVATTVSNGVGDKLTHAGIYGVDVSMGTLSMLYDIPLSYYFKVNFTGFVDIIDALGGITVESEVSFSKDGYTFKVGSNTLDGTAALVFARERKSLSGGDRQRGKNQMAVIKAVINKLISTELLMNYTSVLASVEGSFETNVSYDLIAELVRQQLTDGSSWNIVTYSVDGTNASKIPYSQSAYAYVMIPDETTVEKAKTLMQMVVDGEILTEADVE